MAKLSTRSKHERMYELLGHLGNGKITVQQFWALMSEHGYTNDDIDQFCSFAGIKSGLK